MRIYLPEKSDIHQGHKAEMNITFYGRSILMSMKMKSITVLLNGFSVIETFLLSIL